MHKIKNFSHFKKKYVDVQNFLCIYTNHHVDVGTLSWPVGRVAHAELTDWSLVRAQQSEPLKTVFL